MARKSRDANTKALATHRQPPWGRSYLSARSDAVVEFIMAFIAALEGKTSEDISPVIREAKSLFSSVDVLVSAPGLGMLQTLG